MFRHTSSSITKSLLILYPPALTSFTAIAPFANTESSEVEDSTTDETSVYDTYKRHGYSRSSQYVFFLLWIYRSDNELDQFLGRCARVTTVWAQCSPSSSTHLWLQSRGSIIDPISLSNVLLSPYLRSSSCLFILHRIPQLHTRTFQFTQLSAERTSPSALTPLLLTF